MRRAVVDTNILVSHLLKPSAGGTIGRILDLATEGRFTLLVPEQMLEELLGVVFRKPGLRSRIPDGAEQELAEFLRLHGIVIPRLPDLPFSTLRDADDRYLLTAAIATDAEYLVTGDKDLLVLRSFFEEKPVILTPAEFLAILDQGLNNSSAEYR